MTLRWIRFCFLFFLSLFRFHSLLLCSILKLYPFFNTYCRSDGMKQHLHFYSDWHFWFTAIPMFTTDRTRFASTVWHPHLNVLCNYLCCESDCSWLWGINNIRDWVSEIGCLMSHATIFQLYMWRHIDVQAYWRRSWTYGRAPNAIDIS